MVTVIFEKLDDDARLPAFKTEEAAGADLYALGNYDIAPGEVRMIATGLKMQLPKGYEGQIRPRSGLATKKKLTVVNSPGTVDSDYRGEMFVSLINLSNERHLIVSGDRVAQLVIKKTEDVVFVEGKVNKTKRGEAGYGSTGR